MKFPRRGFLQVAGATVAGLALPQLASALDYPSRPVRLIVAYPPGGSTDILARLVAQGLSESLGQQFVIENRAGAGTNIGTEAVVRAPPDGYTLLVVDNAAAINATLYSKLNFRFIRDITPVAGIAVQPFIMVANPAFSAKTVPEFIAYAKAHPGKVNFASSGIGNANHVFGEMFKMLAGIDMVHVPYRGTGPALTDLLGGQVQIMFGSLLATIEYVRAGQLRALAVTGATRLGVLPDIPTLSEFVTGAETSDWYGIFAPKNTPAEIVNQLNKEIGAMLADPKIKARIVDLGAAVFQISPGELRNFIAEDTDKWAQGVKFSGARAD